MRVDFTGSLIGKYHFRKLLGEGAFGAVWLADELNIGHLRRPVAIKVFVEDRENRGAYLQACDEIKRELEALIALSSDKPIIQVFTSEAHEIVISPDGSAKTLSSIFACPRSSTWPAN